MTPVETERTPVAPTHDAGPAHDISVGRERAGVAILLAALTADAWPADPHSRAHLADAVQGIGQILSERARSARASTDPTVLAARLAPVLPLLGEQTQRETSYSAVRAHFLGEGSDAKAPHGRLATFVEYDANQIEHARDFGVGSSGTLYVRSGQSERSGASFLRRPSVTYTPVSAANALTPERQVAITAFLRRAGDWAGRAAERAAGAVAAGIAANTPTGTSPLAELPSLDSESRAQAAHRLLGMLASPRVGESPAEHHDRGYVLQTVVTAWRHARGLSGPGTATATSAVPVATLRGAPQRAVAHEDCFLDAPQDLHPAVQAAIGSRVPTPRGHIEHPAKVPEILGA